MRNGRKNYHLISYRLLSYSDGWIILNLILAITISVPAWNYYTHGTHITVAHAMGTTIGINTMLLFASIFYIIKNEKAEVPEKRKTWIRKGIIITNIALVIFWASLLGSGLVKISGRLNNEAFYIIIQKCQPYFKVFAYSGTLIFIGLFILIFLALKILTAKKEITSAGL